MLVDFGWLNQDLQSSQRIYFSFSALEVETNPEVLGILGKIVERALELNLILNLQGPEI